MKYDLNGWKILSRQFKSEAHFKEIAVELFGEDFEAAQVRTGEYLLCGEELAALLERIDIPLELKRELLSAVISARNSAEVFRGIAELRQLLCALYSGDKREIPCVALQSLSVFDGKTAKLDRFICDNPHEVLDLPLPPRSAVCKVADAVSAQELSLPCGSMIIIDTANPPAPDEFCLYLKRDNSFGIGALNTAEKAELLWSAPVLRLHIIPRRA